MIAFAEGSLAVSVSAADREQAIRASGELLVSSGRVTAEYVEQMLAAVEEFGPYIVIAPGIALAHARPSEAVLETGLSLAVLAAPVEFGSHNDPVRLVFGLAALDLIRRAVCRSWRPGSRSHCMQQVEKLSAGLASSPCVT